MLARLVSRRRFAIKGVLGTAGVVVSRAVPVEASASKAVVNRPSSPQPAPTIEQLAHRIAIDDLLTRYTIAVDDERFDMLDTVFTPDAILDYTSAGGPRAAYPEVKAWLVERLSTGSPARMHMIGNKEVIIDGNTAQVRAYFFNPQSKLMPNGSYEYSLGGGFYNHKLVLGLSGWRSVELYEKRVWRQGFVPMPHPHNARSTEIWEFGGPARPKQPLD